MTYNQLIESTIVPSWMTPQQQLEQYANLISYVNAVLPQKLYRFRTVSERSLSALYNDEIWFANGSTMNDDFDARLYYDKKEIVNWISSQISTKGGFKVLEDFIHSKKIPIEVVKFIPNSAEFFERIKMLTQDQINEISGCMKEYILDNLEDELINITNSVQKMTKFACFTEKIYSDMMWGQYANNASGFALEYEFGKNNTIVYHDDRDKNYTIWCNLFPIIYGNKRMDTTQYAKYLFQYKMLQKAASFNGFIYPQCMLNQVLPCPDIFMATKIAIKKSSD